MVKEVGSPHDARTREMTFKGSDVLDISAAKEEGIPGISAKKDGKYGFGTLVSGSSCPEWVRSFLSDQGTSFSRVVP
jgi:hypothetical protein